MFHTSLSGAIQPVERSKSWVFTSSYSGATEDTVAALRHANHAGAHTIALVNKADSLMGREAAEVFAYNSKGLYILPMAAIYLFALEIARLQGFQRPNRSSRTIRLPALFQPPVSRRA